MKKLKIKDALLLGIVLTCWLGFFSICTARLANYKTAGSQTVLVSTPRIPILYSLIVLAGRYY